jgi:hypothetical protein
MSETSMVVHEKDEIAVAERGLRLTSLVDLHRFAKYVSVSGFAPKGMEKPESILIAIEMGMEIGLAPMQALQNIAVVNGRPTIWGDAARALVESSGLCEDIAEWFEGEAYKPDYAAVCEVKRKGRSKSVIQRFSVQDATTAGLWKKAGPWTFYPRRMLQMRARAFALRDGFSDVLKGLYIHEEMMDAPVIDVTPQHEPQARPRTIAELGERLEQKTAEDSSVSDNVRYDDALFPEGE